MNIPSYQTDQGHQALTCKPLYFRSASGNISFVALVNPGDTPTQLPRVTTRASDITIIANPQPTSEIPDPYLVHDAIRMFQEKQNNYNKYRNASTCG